MKPYRICKMIQKGVKHLVTFKGIHHVSLAVTDLDKAKDFYGNVLGLKEIERPPFDFPGAWYEIGDQQLHLIVKEDAKTLRHHDSIDGREGHLALRVHDYYETVKYLEEKQVEIVKQPDSTSGFAQIFCKDPDHNIIELNVDQADL